MWNVHLNDTDAFARAYEDLLERYGTDHAQYRSRRIDPGDLSAFFGAPPEERRMPNRQVFDFDGPRGRELSASYVPPAGNPAHEPMMRELRRLFDTHQLDGRFRFEYDTQLFVGELLQNAT